MYTMDKHRLSYPIIRINRGNPLVFCVFLFVFCISSNSSLIANTLVVGKGNINAPYDRILDAIRDATVGDTILIHPGNYSEQLTLDKRVIILGYGYHDPSFVARGNKDFVQVRSFYPRGGSAFSVVKGIRFYRNNDLEPSIFLGAGSGENIYYEGCWFTTGFRNVGFSGTIRSWVFESCVFGSPPDNKQRTFDLERFDREGLVFRNCLFGPDVVIRAPSSGSASGDTTLFVQCTFLGDGTSGLIGANADFFHLDRCVIDNRPFDSNSGGLFVENSMVFNSSFPSGTTQTNNVTGQAPVYRNAPAGNRPDSPEFDFRVVNQPIMGQKTGITAAFSRTGFPPELPRITQVNVVSNQVITAGGVLEIQFNVVQGGH